MKSKQPAPQTKKSKITASQYRRMRRERILCIVLKCILLFTAVLFIWITDIGCAWGWIKNAKAGENWPPDFVGYGQMLIAASALLTIGIVLVFLRRNWTAIGAATVGMILCLISMFRVTAYAAESGFYSQLMDMPVDALYRVEILPTLVPYACLVILALIQFLSVEAREKRLEKKRREETEAPSILEN